MQRFLVLSAFVLASALIAPIAASADDRDHHEKRYYDRSGRDYHTWSSNEDRAYRHYLEEQHREYREFHTVRRGDQDQYFRWRHTHSDNALFKVEIR
jgi:hypothetical protein